MSEDVLIRQSAFEFLRELERLQGEVLPRSELQKGFRFRDRRVPLVGPEGIFKPAAMSELPLSITTAPPRPGREPRYRDEFTSNGLLRYRYRGTDPGHPDNVGLRRCRETGTPLVYFHGVVPGAYLARWPVRIVGDDPGSLTFLVDVEVGIAGDGGHGAVAEREEAILKEYRLVESEQRVHSRAFRERVLMAYRRACAICCLRQDVLLDAAHIIPDSDPRGLPTVPNGLALCKLHHAAFDGRFIGIRPDLVIEVRRDILEEEDGPMLRHGLQEIDGEEIHVPRAKSLRPREEFLAERFDEFRRAG